MSGHASGAGRRLTPDEEERGRQLFADGLSTRQVAAQLGVGNGTAARLRQRLADRGQITPAAGDPETEETTVTQTPDVAAAAVADGQADDAELTRLTTLRDELAAEVATYIERAESSTHAVAELERERIGLLAAGHDAQQLRGRRRDAEDDHRDSATAATLAQGRLDDVGRQIAVVEARQADRKLRAELAAAIVERDRVLAGVGERQRAAILAVRAAAEDFCQVVADDRAVQSRVGQLAAAVTASAAGLGQPGPVVPAAVSTVLQVPAGVTAPLPYTQAMWAAGQNNAERVAVKLAETWGWLPPDPAEVEAERQRLIALRAGMPVPQPPGLAQNITMDPRYGASYSVDEHGNPLRAPDPERRQSPVVPMTPRGHIGGWPI